MDKRAEILEQYLPTPEGHPDTQAIYNAMDENGHQMAIDLLEWMGNNQVRCLPGTTESLFYYNGEWITAEQLFNNFL